jgi:hypothetical protein
VQFGTAGHFDGRYTRLMFSDNTKTLLFVAWVMAVSVAAIAIGITSVPNWIVVTCIALVPPLVALRFWRAPEQTIAESIHDARL